MKKGTLILVLALALVGLAGKAWAAETDAIIVTVSLEIVSVSVSPDVWDIGPIGLAITCSPSCDQGRQAIASDLIAETGSW